MSNWEPISTAPTDGTGFLGFVNRNWIEGFVIVNGDLCYLSDGDMPPPGRKRPTHWQPLPPPPESGT